MPAPPPSPHTPHIGIFDSGVGGLSVLRALRDAMPSARYTYIADSGNAPYGERSDEFIAQRSLALAQALRDRGADLVVVACNTATAAAVEALRRRWPDWPLVGVEPGVKPAVAASPTKRVAVMATPSTLASVRFQRLLDDHAADARVLRLPCPGLAAAIERADPHDATLLRLLDEAASEVTSADVDTVVLGCTHYPLVADLLAQRLPAGIQLLDTAEAIARRAQHLLPQPAAASTASVTAAEPGPVALYSTGDPAPLARLAHHHLGLAEVAGALAV